MICFMVAVLGNENWAFQHCKYILDSSVSWDQSFFLHPSFTPCRIFNESSLWKLLGKALENSTTSFDRIRDSTQTQFRQVILFEWGTRGCATYVLDLIETLRFGIRCVWSVRSCLVLPSPRQCCPPLGSEAAVALPSQLLAVYCLFIEPQAWKSVVKAFDHRKKVFF